jgi:hypothetical protein
MSSSKLTCYKCDAFKHVGTLPTCTVFNEETNALEPMCLEKIRNQARFSNKVPTAILKVMQMIRGGQA